jgi:hypothetical protein
MCHVSAGKQISQVNSLCGCTCNCPAMLPVEEEIKNLEVYKKCLLDRIQMIETKISGLKTVNKS